MWGWVTGRPPCCLKFGVESVAWAESRWNWHGGRRYRCVSAPIPSGSVKPSPADSNLSGLPELKARLQALAGPPQDVRILGQTVLANRPRPVTLLLPDAAVRAVVLHLEHLPARAKEREALIRWRLGQEQLFPLAGATVVSQVLSPAGARQDHAPPVLAIAVQQSVLSQYESVCEAVGLIPQAVGLTSLHLFNLWVRMSAGQKWQEADLLWVTLTDRALTTMIFQRGRLMLYRCKWLAGEADEAGHGSERAIQKIVEECAASAEVCQQRHPGVALKGAVICVEDHLMALPEKLGQDLGLSVKSWGWREMQSRARGTGEPRQGVASLAALAGVAA